MILHECRKFGIGIEFLAVQWRQFLLWASVVREAVQTVQQRRKKLLWAYWSNKYTVEEREKSDLWLTMSDQQLKNLTIMTYIQGCIL